MSILQRDHDGLVETVLHWDEHTQTLHVERTQDVEPLLDRNMALRAAGWDGFNNDRSLQAIAEVPITVLEQWHKEGVNYLDPDHNAEVMKRLRDPALSKLRLDTPSANRGHIIVLGER
jgi:hypothetical protein